MIDLLANDDTDIDILASGRRLRRPSRTSHPGGLGASTGSAVGPGPAVGP